MRKPVLALVLAASVLTPAAAEARTPERARPRSPGEHVLRVDPRSGRIEPDGIDGDVARLRALMQRDELGDTAEIERLLRVAHSRALPRGSARADEPEAQSEDIRYLFPAGDLDEDGRNDLLTLRYGFGAFVEGVKGSTGQVLWSVPFGLVHWEHALFPTDADQGPAVFVFAPAPYVSAPFERTGTASVVALGRDGSTLWRRDVLTTTASAWPAGGEARLDSTAAVGLMEDATGDGIPDFAVSRLTSVSAGADLVYRYVVEVIDGASGDVAAAHELVSRSYPEARVTPDMSGDGLDDLVIGWESIDGQTVSAFAASRSGARLWERHLRFDAHAELHSAGDADGDGRADIVAYSWEFEYEERVGNLGLLSGSDGSDLWRMRALEPRMGDLDGDGLFDVLLWDFDQLIVRYRGINGRTGRQMFTSSYVVEARKWISLSLIPDVGDANGDGVTDAAHEAVEGSLFSDSVTVRDARTVSGRDGSTIWGGRPGRPLFGDIDGRGGDDQVRIKQVKGSFGRREVYVALAGEDGSTLWLYNRGDEFDDQYTLSLFAHDVAGDERADTVVAIFTVRAEGEAPIPGWYYASFRSDLLALAHDGSLIWHG